MAILSKDKFALSVLSMDATIADAMEALNASPVKLIVIMDENTLCGVVSDGDIRRALLDFKNLSDPAMSIMSTAPIIANSERSESQLKAIANKHKIRYLPLLDNNKNLVAMYEASSMECNLPKDSKVFLMAGGFGTRLYPLTENTPKPLLKVGEKPIIETIMESFVAFGFNSFFLSLHYKADMIKNYFNERSDVFPDISYIEESSPLGTAGALSLIPKQTDPLILMNADLLTKVNFSELLEHHNAKKASITVCVREHVHTIPYGVVEIDDMSITDINEKPTQKYFVNAGIYCISPEVLDSLQHGEKIDMPTVINQCLASGDNVSVFPIHEYWLDIGQMRDFQQAQIDVSSLF